MPKAEAYRVGLIGYPIRHSLSPTFQQAAFDFHGIPATYEAWETSERDLAPVVAGLRAGNYLGANVTVPHKQAALPLIDEPDPIARRIGAVNTIVNRAGRLAGYNTDAAGFLAALQDEAGYTVRGKRALVVGAGGAARAVAFAMAAEGLMALAIANRSIQRAADLALAVQRDTELSEVRAIDLGDPVLSTVALDADLLINATLVGTRHTAYERALPVPRAVLHAGLLVCDLVYNPSETPLLAAAGRCGARTLGGLAMLIYQGAASFELWTNEQPPIGLMFARAREKLAEGG